MPDPTKKRASKRERLDAAFRVRAGTQGLLACCTCLYPIEPASTATGHAEDCRAHGMTLSALIAGTHWHLAWTKSGLFDAPTTTPKRARTK